MTSQTSPTPNSADDVRSVETLIRMAREEMRNQEQAGKSIGASWFRDMADTLERLSSPQSDLVEPSADVEGRLAALEANSHPPVELDPILDAVAKRAAEYALSASPAPSQSGLVEAIKRALACTPTIVQTGEFKAEIRYDCGNPWEILREALRANDQTAPDAGLTGRTEGGEVSNDSTVPYE